MNKILFKFYLNILVELYSIFDYLLNRINQALLMRFPNHPHVFELCCNILGGTCNSSVSSSFLILKDPEIIMPEFYNFFLTSPLQSVLTSLNFLCSISCSALVTFRVSSQYELRRSKGGPRDLQSHMPSVPGIAS